VCGTCLVVAVQFAIYNIRTNHFFIVGIYYIIKIRSEHLHVHSQELEISKEKIRKKDQAPLFYIKVFDSLDLILNME
jgi:hypothetical protein